MHDATFTNRSVASDHVNGFVPDETDNMRKASIVAIIYNRPK
jgi:hypothetical protein